MTPSPPWSELLAKHESWLRRVLYARLGAVDEVDEVYQELAVAVAAQDAGGPTPSPWAGVQQPAPWLYRVAVRQALMHRRQQGRRRKLQQRLVERHVEPAEPDPLDWLLADERRQQLRAALDELSPRDREILLLKHAENWSYRQLAENLGLSQAAVEARLFRARQRLRQRLAAKQVTEALS